MPGRETKTPVGPEIKSFTVPKQEAEKQRLGQMEQTGPVPLVRLQQTVGNQATLRLLHAQVLQRRLAISGAEESYEREADQVAQQVARVLEANTGYGPAPCAEPGVRQAGQGNKSSANCRIQSQAPPSVVQLVRERVTHEEGASEVTPEIEETIQQAEGTGQPLPDTVRHKMESAFGLDFSGVRIHTDDRAHILNRAVNAVAFTTGQNIFFRAGAYDPESSCGRELLAHELTHVVQQNGSRLGARPCGLQTGGECQECGQEKNQGNQSGGDLEPMARGNGPTPATPPSAAPPSPTPPSASPPTPAPPTPCVMTSATALAAADGATANTRTTVGSCESVTFTVGGSADWTATSGSPTVAAGTASFTWRAPEGGGSTTITATTTGNPAQTCSKIMTTIVPSSISMTKASEDAVAAGVAGAGMRLSPVKFNPDTVCFGNIEWLEVPGGPSNVTGYFLPFQAAGADWMNHHPTPSFVPVDAHNQFLPGDHAAGSGFPAPWSAGTFDWSIPNKLRQTSTAGAGIVFTTTLQQFTIAADGTVTIRKQGASVSRHP